METAMENRNSFIRFLSCNLFKGIGEKTATKIFDALGENLLEIIGNTAIEKINIDRKLQKKLEVIKEFTQSPKSGQLQRLIRAGATINLCFKLFAEYKAEEIDEMFLYPELVYEKLVKIDGVGFIVADKIAIGLGVKESFERVKYAVRFFFKSYNGEGHHCQIKVVLLKDLKKLFQTTELQISEESLIEAVKELKNRKDIVDSPCNPLLAKTSHDDHLEKKLAHLIKERVSEDESQRAIELLPQFLELLAMTDNFTMTEKQIEAMKMVCKNNLSILIGAAGTGKSFTTAIIVKFLVYCGYSVFCLAPTGKATQRTSELLKKRGVRKDKVQPLTVHKFMFNIPNHCDYILLDEVSMMSSFLMSELLRSTGDRLSDKGFEIGGAKVLLIGDKYQLPSINAGNVLSDMMASGVVPITELDIPQRAMGAQKLPQLFDGIKEGILHEHLIRTVEPEGIEEAFSGDEEIVFVGCQGYEITEKLRETLKELSKISDLTANTIIISPTNENENGVRNLNTNVRSIYNPYGEPIHGCNFKVGDRVMQTKNQYEDKDLISANGDIGFVKEWYRCRIDQSIVVKVRWQNGTNYDYKGAWLNQLVLNYAITVHKSQGSEYQDVIVILDSAHTFQHCRQLLYTALSRSKRRIILVGDMNVLKRGVQNNKPAKRYTDLTKLILAE